MCEEHLNTAKSRVTAAIAAIAAAPLLVLVAVALNGGFFTAPGAPIPMVAAGVAALAAAALLGQAREALKMWVNCGGASPECAGRLSNIENMLAAAITTIGILATACFGVAAGAWIPWFTQVPMWTVYAALLIGAATLGLIPLMWAPLDTCQADAARARGPLLSGEKASDPWFLRLAPSDGVSYARPGNAELIAENKIDSRWLRCSLLGVDQWLIGAVASIKGTPSGAVAFSWTVAGNAVPATSYTSDDRSSMLAYGMPPVGESAFLQVDAVDGTGYRRSIRTELYLGRDQLGCLLTLPLVPIERKSPAVPWTEERLRPALEVFWGAVREIVDRENPQVIDRPQTRQESIR